MKKYISLILIVSSMLSLVGCSYYPKIEDNRYSNSIFQKTFNRNNSPNDDISYFVPEIEDDIEIIGESTGTSIEDEDFIPACVTGGVDFEMGPFRCDGDGNLEASLIFLKDDSYFYENAENMRYLLGNYNSYKYLPVIHITNDYELDNFVSDITQFNVDAPEYGDMKKTFIRMMEDVKRKNFFKYNDLLVLWVDADGISTSRMIGETVANEKELSIYFTTWEDDAERINDPNGVIYLYKLPKSEADRYIEYNAIYYKEEYTNEPDPNESVAITGEILEMHDDYIVIEFRSIQANPKHELLDLLPLSLKKGIILNPHELIREKVTYENFIQIEFINYEIDGETLIITPLNIIRVPQPHEADYCEKTKMCTD